jgi:GDPmannose 4,6-dehydratase
MAFAAAGIEVNFSGEGVNEIGTDAKSGRTLVKVSPQFFRPAEVDLLLGDASKAKKLLGWEPKTSVAKLCQMMVEADIDRQKRGFTR